MQFLNQVDDLPLKVYVDFEREWALGVEEVLSFLPVNREQREIRK